MSVNAGDVLEIKCSHPSVGDRVFYPISNEEVTFDPGGIRIEDDDNATDGGGRAIFRKSNKRWSLTGPIANDTSLAVPDHNFLALVAAAPEEADWTISVINGTVWGAKGSVLGEIQPNFATGRIDIKIGGGGKAEKIV